MSDTNNSLKYNMKMKEMVKNAYLSFDEARYSCGYGFLIISFISWHFKLFSLSLVYFVCVVFYEKKNVSFYSKHDLPIK